MKKTKEVIELTKYWYNKIKVETNFEDIETFDANMDPFDILKKDTFKYGLTIKDKYVGNLDYYMTLSQFLHTDKVPEELRPVLELHNEGLTITKIANALKISRNKVHNVIKKVPALLRESGFTR